MLSSRNWILLSVLTLSIGCKTSSSQLKDIELTQAQRDERVRSARVFQGIEKPSELSEEAIKNGPFPQGATEGINYFKSAAKVRCEFSQLNFEKPPSGQSPKFLCDLLNAEGKVVAKKLKIKYDSHNPEIYNEVAASRLLWLLGFPADYYYSVQLSCLGCPDKEDPWTLIKRYKTLAPAEQLQIKQQLQILKDQKAESVFSIAMIEKKFGEEIVIEKTDQSGWSFADDLVVPTEQLLFPEADKPQQRAQREALTILAAMLSHVDNQPGNQRLYCRRAAADGSCPTEESFLVIQDLGATMGGFRLNWELRGDIADKAQLKLAMDIWEDDHTTAVFTGAKTCEVSVASLSDAQTLGPRKKVKVSEAGRRFLISRFVALGGGEGETLTPPAREKIRQQLHSVFLAGRNGELYKNVDWWVKIVMKKLELVTNYKGCQG